MNNNGIISRCLKWYTCIKTQTNWTGQTSNEEPHLAGNESKNTGLKHLESWTTECQQQLSMPLSHGIVIQHNKFGPDLFCTWQGVRYTCSVFSLWDCCTILISLACGCLSIAYNFFLNIFYVSSLQAVASLYHASRYQRHIIMCLSCVCWSRGWSSVWYCAFFMSITMYLYLSVCVHLVDTLHKSTFVASVFGESGSLFWFATAVFGTYL